MTSESRPIELVSPPSEAVVEFGSPAEKPSRWGAPAGSLGRGLAADRRAVPLAAALGAVAVFASLVSEWQVTSVDRAVLGGEVGDRLIPTDIADLGALGTGYLVGVFVLATTVVLTLFGPPAGRHYARLTGLSAGGTALVLLIALATSLGGQSRIISRLYTLELDDEQLSLAYGRGLWCAFVGVAFALLALYLAGRHLAAVETPAAEEQPIPESPEPAAVWSWRRPPAAEEPDGQPLDLTVGPARPFTSREEDRDREGRPGISG